MERLLLFFAGAAAGIAATALAARVLSRRRFARHGAVQSRLAHDLRTPLSSITAYAEILGDDGAIEPGERSRFVGIIQQEAGRMEAMIEDRLGRVGANGDGRALRTRPVVPAAASRTILVVDDDRFLVEATRTLLAREGFTAVGAYDGPDALAQARSVRPDLILMDLRMPGMTGEEALRRLRDDAATREIPVIITTGDETTLSLPGAAAILTKPVTRERLISAIDAAARAAYMPGGTQG